MGNMNAMFQDASAFNQDIGKWDVGKVSSMDRMFSGAWAFDRDLSTWAVGRVFIASDMLLYCPRIREAHMPPTGLTVRGPRAAELRPELTRLIDELGLSSLSVVCVDTTTGPVRVSLNKTMAFPGSLDQFTRTWRAKVQDKLLRCICGFYGGPEVPEASKAKGREAERPSSGNRPV